jgi:hypothetical protein
VGLVVCAPPDMNQEDRQLLTDFEHLVNIIEESETKKETNNKKMEVCHSTLIYWMDANQAKIEANCEEWMGAMKAGQERIEA